MTELGHVFAGDAPVVFDVLQDHVFLLERLEPALVDVGSLFPQPAVSGCRKMPGPSLPLAA
jgi:hypothetical protein